MDILANKVANIIMAKADEKSLETATMMADWLWNTPFKTQDDYRENMKGRLV